MSGDHVLSKFFCSSVLLCGCSCSWGETLSSVEPGHWRRLFPPRWAQDESELLQVNQVLLLGNPDVPSVSSQFPLYQMTRNIFQSLKELQAALVHLVESSAGSLGSPGALAALTPGLPSSCAYSHNLHCERWWLCKGSVGPQLLFSCPITQDDAEEVVNLFFWACEAAAVFLS